MRHRVNLPSIGTALTGLGMLCLYEKLAGATSQLAALLSANGSHVIGILPASILLALQFSHTAGLVPHVLVSFWPLLPVTMGVMLTQNQPKDAQNLRK